MRCLTVEPDRGHVRQQFFSGEDWLCLLEICGVQVLQQMLRRGLVLILRPQQQLMGHMRVAARRVHEAIGQSLSRGDVGDLAHHLLRASNIGAVLASNDLDRAMPVSSGTGIQLKRAVHDMCVGDPSVLEGTLQATLPNKAPWTHDIGPHFNFH